MSTGFTLDGFPSMGSWVSYALGSANQDLPAFVAIPDPRGVPQIGPNHWNSGFLPAVFQGTAFNADKPIPNLAPPPAIGPAAERATRDFLKLLNDQHLARHPGDSELAARIASYELAARMQLSAARGRRSVAGNRSHAAGLRRRRPEPAQGRLRPQLPAGPAAARARRAVRAALQRRLRHGRGRRQLGRPPKLQEQYEVHAPILDQPCAAPAQRPETARPARRHAGACSSPSSAACPPSRKGPAAATTTRTASPSGSPERA